MAQAIRKDGYGQISKVGAVVLETDGSFSVISRSDGPLDLLYDVRCIGNASEELLPSDAAAPSER